MTPLGFLGFCADVRGLKGADRKAKIEAAIAHIKHGLQTTGERELPSRLVGERVMEALRELDQVAYVRFASVYRSFQDISEFRAELDKLESKNRSDLDTGAAP